MWSLARALIVAVPLATPSASTNASARAWSALLAIALASELLVATRVLTICVPPPDPLATDERCTPGVLAVAGEEADPVTTCLFLGSQLRMRSEERRVGNGSGHGRPAAPKKRT